MTDRLTLSRALEESGMSGPAADRIATEIYDAIHDNVATKGDLRDLEQRLEVRFSAMDTRFEELRHLTTRMTIALGAVVVAVAGVLHYWK